MSRSMRWPLAILLALVALAMLADAKLITGLAPCPSGAPPARECLVSVLVDLRAFRARARERTNATQGTHATLPAADHQVSLTPSSKDASQEPSQDLPLAPPPSAARPQQAEDLDVRQEQQRRRQQQLEQAVRFQEDELQQLREQVQELRLQLARALQLYQLPPGVGLTQGSTSRQTPPVKSLRGTLPAYPQQTVLSPPLTRRFYRTVAAPPAAAAAATPVFGQRLSLVGLRELARGETVVAT